MKRIIFIAVFGFIIFSSCKYKQHRFYAKDELKLGADEDTLWRLAMKKFTLNFNTYRKDNNLPLLPENFYLLRSGGDYAEWKNPTGKYPAYDEKIITWFATYSDDPTLIWENNLIKGENGDWLRFRYGRHQSDSLILNYDLVDHSFRKETDSFYWRSYHYFHVSGVRETLTKQQYDSVLTSWGVRL